MGTYRQPSTIKRDEGAFMRGFEKGVQPLEEMLVEEQKKKDLAAKQSAQRISRTNKAIGGIKSDVKYVSTEGGLKFNVSGNDFLRNAAQRRLINFRDNTVLSDGVQSKEEEGLITGLVGNFNSTISTFGNIVGKLGENEIFDIPATNLDNALGITPAALNKAWNDGTIDFLPDGSGVVIDGVILDKDKLAEIESGSNFAVKANLNEITNAISEDIEALSIGDDEKQNEAFRAKFQNDLWSKAISVTDRDQLSSVYYQAMVDGSYNPSADVEGGYLSKKDQRAFGNKIGHVDSKVLESEISLLAETHSEITDRSELEEMAKSKIRKDKETFAFRYLYHKSLEKQKYYGANQETGVPEFIGAPEKIAKPSKEELSYADLVKRTQQKVNDGTYDEISRAIGAGDDKLYRLLSAEGFIANPVESKVSGEVVGYTIKNSRTGKVYSIDSKSSYEEIVKILQMAEGVEGKEIVKPAEKAEVDLSFFPSMGK